MTTPIPAFITLIAGTNHELSRWFSSDTISHNLSRLITMKTQFTLLTTRAKNDFERRMSQYIKHENGSTFFTCVDCGDFEIDVSDYTANTSTSGIYTDIMTYQTILKHLTSLKHRFAEYNNLFPDPPKPPEIKKVNFTYEINKNVVVFDGKHDYFCDCCEYSKNSGGNEKTDFYIHLKSKQHIINRIELLIELTTDYVFDWKEHTHPVILSSRIQNDGFIHIQEEKQQGHQTKRWTDKKKVIKHYRCIACCPPYTKLAVGDLTPEQIEMCVITSSGIPRPSMNRFQAIKHMASPEHLKATGLNNTFKVRVKKS